MWKHAMSFAVSQGESFLSSRANQMTAMKPQGCAYHIRGRYPTTISEILYRHLVLIWVEFPDSRRTGKTFSYHGSVSALSYHHDSLPMLCRVRHDKIMPGRDWMDGSVDEWKDGGVDGYLEKYIQ